MKFFLTVLLAAIFSAAWATDSRSDSIDILNYSIRLDASDIPGNI